MNDFARQKQSEVVGYSASFSMPKEPKGEGVANYIEKRLPAFS
jgi:hypothetical protein